MQKIKNQNKSIKSETKENYGNGFNHNELYNMPIPLRRFYAQKLIDAKNKESEQIDKIRNKGKTEISRPTFQKS